MDDEFNSWTLDSKWAVTEGSPGTVDLTATSSGAVYDLTSVDDNLAIQVDNNKVHLRQDYTLPDSKSVVIKLHTALNSSGSLVDQVVCGISLNTSDNTPLTSSTSGYMAVDFRSNADGWKIYAEYKSPGGVVTATAIGEDGDESPINGNTVYLRIARVGSSYIFYTSFNGISWIPMYAAITPAATFTNVWIRCRSDANTGSNILPVSLIDWIREVDNSEWIMDS